MTALPFDLLLWSRTPKPFDDLVYVGDGVTIAQVKAAVRERFDTLVGGAVVLDQPVRNAVGIAVEPRLTWLSVTDGPIGSLHFEYRGAVFNIDPAKHGTYRVACVTCGDVVHEGTTNPRYNVEFHLRDKHGVPL